MTKIIENRKHERIAIREGIDIFFTVSAIEYKVLDISVTGLRVRSDVVSQFSLTQILDNCELNFPNLSLKPIFGQVIHSIANPEGGANFGILFLGMDQSCTDQLYAKIKELKTI